MKLNYLFRFNCHFQTSPYSVGASLPSLIATATFKDCVSDCFFSDCYDFKGFFSDTLKFLLTFKLKSFSGSF